MKISEIRKLDANLKGFILVGKVAAIYKDREVKGTKNNKDYCFVTTSIKLEDDTGKIYVQFIDVKDDFKNGVTKTISCINCSINDYEDKQGVMQRSLKAKNYSFNVIPADTAHPELPPTRTISQEPESQVSIPTHTGPEKKEVVQPNVWSEKDLRIVRQNSNLHATTLICKYFKGNLEEAIAEVIKTSNILVESVYQDLDFPIKNKTQADRIADMKADSDKNVADAAENVASLRTPTEEGDLIEPASYDHE